MTDYRIICTVKEPHHGHIAKVGIDFPDNRYAGQKTVPEVYDMMEEDKFHTGSAERGDYALVVKFDCTHCGRPTLRSEGDSETANNLDELDHCG